ncbi:calcium-transporting ATPase 5, plasma membrane-type-like [Zingiber officinale]|uniref:calcium-transporting ATPase 5, plasma membrane-type-like n=1 Tax=Zingiber officinale TaxID=94328 RepID=UPI001C4CC158|nr:calcium-transporting ATPase 5, plasma membrane-type-like [Zingiber officinale]
MDPMRRDEEYGLGGSSEIVDADKIGAEDDAFAIPPKNAPTERLRRWRQAALVLNAARRFRYTLDLKKENEKEEVRSKIRTHTQVIRAAFLFKEAGETPPPPDATGGKPVLQEGDFPIAVKKLMEINREHDLTALKEFGGVKGLSNILKSSTERGIVGDETDLLNRRNIFGANTYPQKKGKSFLVFVWEACQDLTLIILMVASVLSLVLGIKTEGLSEGWYDGGSIAFAVILVILVTAISDYKQSLQFQHLNEEKRNIHLEVIRGGRRIEVSIYDIVVGDILPLKIGDQVPADGILVSGLSLAIDESSMTGEAKIVHKDQKAPFLMSGCKVSDGYGTMLVTAVGINTEWGLLMANISEDNGEETPLQVRLNGLATLIGTVGLSVAVAVLVVLMSRYFTGHTKNPDGTIQFLKGQTSASAAFDGAVKILTIAVTIVVVAVPEGLPLAVTLTLAYSMRKMMADKALVRRLSACETMGSATTICSDKTGTLTLNQMTVVEALVGGMNSQSLDNCDTLSKSLVSLLIEGIAQNTTGNVFEPEDGGIVEVTGSPTEKAILSWGIKLGMKFDLVRKSSSILHAVPFNSEKKRGGVAINLADSTVHVHWKGAAELILAACTRWIDIDGSIQMLNPEKACLILLIPSTNIWLTSLIIQVDEFKKSIEIMAAKSLRCVAFAYKMYDHDRVPEVDKRGDWKLPEDELVMLAIVGIKDPCRPGVREAVTLCTSAGVKVRMVTGDNIETAKAIAMECGILDPTSALSESSIIEGREFRVLSESARQAIADKICVMGRSSPNDKLLLVQALRKKGHVVAVTGDGTNDAPALHEADIGLSMGIQGTEVAKESSDIIILDDNFASVVKVVRWGRSVYANIQKFIQFQLTVNIAALIINVVAAVSTGDVPLNAVQLLWVNLIMDTLGALALATEPPTNELMKRSPVGRREPLVTNIMWRNIIVQALYQVGILLIFNFAGKNILHLLKDDPAHAEKVKTTFVFNTFVFCQIFNEFNARKPNEMNIFSGVTKNYLFMGIIGITLILQARKLSMNFR